MNCHYCHSKNIKLTKTANLYQLFECQDCGKISISYGIKEVK